MDVGGIRLAPRGIELCEIVLPARQVIGSGALPHLPGDRTARGGMMAPARCEMTIPPLLPICVIRLGSRAAGSGLEQARSAPKQLVNFIAINPTDVVFRRVAG